ncbi:hypothetical protein CXG81DRAFT_8670 [Caulochytrium protostelioides]|uniref:Mitochondrial inner membrane protease ATP23 n=1 Tax=Caulochytrium protostelioides TaxID=1555241 RepID=A0A4P9XF07_9FUNG|nr:hypothetical protein CXG81DRAFT_8670 [Caulochytrium protostelioides]|eukprot:RKP04153.1 hypothetical protein CXG81DRAFT_8670 [Caulochytrium protostelioides]
MRLPPTGIVAASSAAAAPPHRSASPDAAATPGSGPRSSAPADAETEAQRAKRVQKQAKDCERWKARLLQSSPIVRFMRDELARAGCPFPPGLFRCQPCDAGAPAAIAGGFVPTQGIVLCQETLVNRDHMEDTMAHELIHAFDQCTTRVDWSQCAHLACSEIRAANLSGDCKFGRELKRGNWALAAKHHQACVKRRAILSLQNAKNCAEGHVAEEAVRHVWPHCFPDTAPFDEIY